MANYPLTWNRLVRNLGLRLKRSFIFTLFLIFILSFTLSVFALVNQNHVQFNGMKNYLRGTGGDGPLEAVQMKKIHELKWSTNRPKHRKMVQFYPDNQIQRHELQGSWQDTSEERTVIDSPHILSNVSQGVHIFYYAWYGNPKHDDGKWYHWNHQYLPNWDKTDGRVFPRGSHYPEESDDRLCFATDGPENSAECQTEEDDAKGVGAAPVGKHLGVGGRVRRRIQFLFVLCSCCLECSLEEVIGNHAPAEVEEVVHDLDLPLRLVARAHHCLDLRAARVDDDHKDKADGGGEQGGDGEEHNRPHGNHPVHLCVQTCSAGDQTSND